MKTPTVHLNGTSKQNLSDGYRNTYTKLSDALEMLAINAPHPRDYYVQKDENAFIDAMREHQARMNKLNGIMKEIQALWEAIEN
jgi:hypothetical protein